MILSAAVRAGVAGLALLAASSGPAQSQQMMPAPTPTADALAAQMRVLAADPRNVGALIAAGDLSTRLGDLAAAFAFFARAAAIEPTNPRIAAGRAGALVASQRPGEALRLYEQADRAGISMEPYLAQRGLAYDLTGQPGHAQRDYRRALLREPDDETVRRLALSLGISGRRDEALTVLDPLLRRSDRAAWRARAMVLALSGDVPGAQRIAASMIVGGAALTPFFGRLSALSPADRAFAVHFGEIGTSMARINDARLAPAVAALPEPRPTIRPVETAAVVTRAPEQTRRSRRSRQPDREPRAGSLLAARIPVPAARPTPTPAPTPSPVLPAPVQVAANTRSPVPTPIATASLPQATPLASTASTPTTMLSPPLPASVPTASFSSPAARASLPSPAASVPLPSPAASASLTTPVASAPPPSPAASAPLPSPAASAPLPSPAASASFPSPAASASLTTPAASAPLPTGSASAPVPQDPTPRGAIAPSAAPSSLTPRESIAPVALASASAPYAGASGARPSPVPVEIVSLPQRLGVAPQASLPAPQPVTMHDAPAPASDPLPAPAPAAIVAPPRPTPAPPAAAAPQERPSLAAIIDTIAVPASELDVAPVTPSRPAPERVAAREEPKPPARKVEVKKPEPAAKAADAKPADPAAKKGDAKKPDPKTSPNAKKSPEAKKPDPAKVEPQRWWVQVAGGANAADLDKDWKRLAAKSGAAFRGRSAYTTPLRATNRLLTGPFKSQAEAMAFVNQLAKDGTSAFAWQSPAGQKIDRLSTR